MGLGSAALVLLTCVLWGGTPVAISYSVDTLPPIAVAGFRFALAACVMLVWCRHEGSGFRLERWQWKYAVIAGFLMFMQISLFNIGVAWSNSSHGSLLINSGVFGVVALEHFVTKNDRLTPRKTFGLILAATCVVGILVITGSNGDDGLRDQPSLAGDLLLLGSACVLAVSVVYTKHAVAFVAPGKLIFWHDVVGTVLFFALSGLTERMHLSDFTLPAVIGVLYQGICVAGLCFAIQAHLLRKHSASQIAVFGFAMPLFGIMFGNLFRGDPLSLWIVVAGIGVAVGILLVNASPRVRTDTAEPEGPLPPAAVHPTTADVTHKASAT